MDNSNLLLPDRLAFKQKEVINITKLEGKVIDYWQNEFGGFEPTVNKEGEKFYNKKNIQLILKIKQWLIVEKIEKSKIKEMIKIWEGHGDTSAVKVDSNTDSPEKMRTVSIDQLKIIKRSLQEILTILDKHDK